MNERLGICCRNCFTWLGGDCLFSSCDTGIGTFAFIEGGTGRVPRFSAFTLAGAGAGAGGRLTTVADGKAWRGEVSDGALSTGSVISSVDDNRIGSISGK